MNNLSISKSKEKNDQSKEDLSNTTELISNKKNNIKTVLIPNKEKYNKISQLQIYFTIKPKPNIDKQNNTVNNDYTKRNTNQTFMKKKMEIFNSGNSNTSINKAKVPLNIFYQNLKNQQENQRNNYLFKIPNNKIKLYIQKNYNKNNRNKMTHLYHNSNLTGETYFNNELSSKQNKVISKSINTSGKKNFTINMNTGENYFHYKKNNRLSGNSLQMTFRQYVPLMSQ